MKVKEIIEHYFWDRTPDLHHREKENTWRDEIMNEPKEHIYILQDKNGKSIRTGLSHKAAAYLKDRKDLIKKYGPLRVVRVQ